MYANGQPLDLYVGSNIMFFHWYAPTDIKSKDKTKKGDTWELTVEGLNCKRPIPLCRLFFKIDLLTDIAALCLTDFIDWYIHSLVGIFDPACELLPPWTKDLYLYTVAPLSSLWPPPPLPQLNVQFDSVCLGGGGELCCVDHILQEFYTLFLTRCRTYQITSPPQTKWPVKTTLRGWCL